MSKFKELIFENTQVKLEVKDFIEQYYNDTGAHLDIKDYYITIADYQMNGNDFKEGFVVIRVENGFCHEYYKLECWQDSFSNYPTFTDILNLSITKQITRTIKFWK